jgi:transcriptional regulator with XRE-family HTH domain
VTCAEQRGHPPSGTPLQLPTCSYPKYDPIRPAESTSLVPIVWHVEGSAYALEMSFGARLTDARKKKGLTQSQLGEGLGTDGADCSKAVVYGWEKDQHFPRVDQLALICRKLGTTADFLLFGQVSEGTLLPDVAEVASAVNSLPERQRNWVLMTAREAISLAQETIAPSGNYVSHPGEDSDLSHHKGTIKSSNGR